MLTVQIMAALNALMSVVQEFDLDDMSAFTPKQRLAIARAKSALVGLGLL